MVKPIETKCQGKCPQCRSDNISYSDSENIDNMIKYEIVCNECDYEGEEWYKEVYIESI
jgi:hypothetical protein